MPEKGSVYVHVCMRVCVKKWQCEGSVRLVTALANKILFSTVIEINKYSVATFTLNKPTWSTNLIPTCENRQFD